MLLACNFVLVIVSSRVAILSIVFSVEGQQYSPKNSNNNYSLLLEQLAREDTILD